MRGTLALIIVGSLVGCSVLPGGGRGWFRDGAGDSDVPKQTETVTEFLGQPRPEF